MGSSRQHLIAACEGSLRRPGTDTIDVYQIHAFDALTPVEETLHALDDLVRTGKVRYVGCSGASTSRRARAPFRPNQAHDGVSTARRVRVQGPGAFAGI
jgi:aryl-alcohol dehydrogenase-like predicted oxidoreductase